MSKLGAPAVNIPQARTRYSEIGDGFLFSWIASVACTLGSHKGRARSGAPASLRPKRNIALLAGAFSLGCVAAFQNHMRGGSPLEKGSTIWPARHFDFRKKCGALFRKLKWRAGRAVRFFEVCKKRKGGLRASCWLLRRLLTRQCGRCSASSSWVLFRFRHGSRQKMCRRDRMRGRCKMST